MTLRSRDVGRVMPARLERVSAVVEGVRSFYDEEVDEEDDQDGDQDGEEAEEETDDDGHHVPLPKKATANAGSPGSGGSTATPAKSLRDDDSCPSESQLAVSM